MKAFQAMLAYLDPMLSGHSLAKIWAGPISDGFQDPVEYQIAAQVGYRVPINHRAFPLDEITLTQASGLLAFIAVDSLAYTQGTPIRAEIAEVIRKGLQDLGPEARFFSNGDWHLFAMGALPPPPLTTQDESGLSVTASFGWMSISDATFDTGVIGFNDEIGFIIWCEEED